MSKIIIREYDNTKAVGPEYKNFSVVVPGFINADKTATFDQRADENGVFECSSSADFEAVIGYVPGYTGPVPAEAVAFDAISKDAGSQQEIKYKAVGNLSIQELLDYQDELYFCKVNQYGVQDIVEEPKDFTGGHLVSLTLPDYPTPLPETETGKPAYKLTKATAEWLKDPANQNTNVYRITAGHTGRYPISKTQNGNQIAYELVQLGYTVLFKKLDNTTLYDPADGSKVAAGGISGTSVLDYDWFWACFKDKANYDFRYIITGGYFEKEAAKQIAKLATFKNKPAGEDYLDNAEAYANAGRGDCLALIDVDEDDVDIKGQTTQAGILAGIQKYTNKFADASGDVLTKECKILVPQVIYDYVNPKYRQDITQTTTTFPASFHYLACANKAFNEYNEWYAVAGYQRGICDLKVAGTTITLGDYAVNVLQPRKASRIAGDESEAKFVHAVNPIIKVRKAYYLWGNRTAAPLLDASTTVGSGADLKASHFTNIRQLCITLKKQLYVACRKFTFDPNSDILWVNFCNVIRPTLEKMKADQGITDYKFIKVKNKRKALLTAKIRIVPIEAVEDFDISIYLEDSISGVTVSAEEVND